MLSNLFSARLFSASSPPKMSSRISWTSLPRWDTCDTVIGQQIVGALTLVRACLVAVIIVHCVKHSVGFVSPAEKEVPCTSLGDAAWLEATLWTLPGLTLDPWQQQQSQVSNFQHWEDSSPAVRGLLKSPQGFKAQIKAVIKVTRAQGSSCLTDLSLIIPRFPEDTSPTRARVRCLPSGLTCSVLQTGAHLGLNINKVNRCLARYSPRATTTGQPINRALIGW